MDQTNHKQAPSRNSRLLFTAIGGIGILSGVIYAINFDLYERVPVFSGLSGLQIYVILFLLLSLFYFVSIFLTLRMKGLQKKSWGLTILILFSAMVFRLVLIAEDPAVLSNDMYRYIWDGRVQQNGINPYLFAPEADELEHLRDDQIYPNLNRKAALTLYPAGSQLYFRLCYLLVGDSVNGYKGIMVFFDVLTLLVLVALLQRWGLNSTRIIIYAWNPLVIIEIAYSGHLEGLAVFLVVTALYLHTIHKQLPAIVMIALSATVKMYPALLLAALLNRGSRIKGIIVFAATVVLFYLPFVGAGSHLSGFLPVYLKNPYESFNLGLKYLVMGLVPGLDYYLLSLVFILALAVAGGFVFLKEKKDSQVLWHAYLLTGWLLLLMPAALHPWYVILIIPFLIFYPSPAWLIFACTVTLSYLKYTSPLGVMPIWIILVEYLPLLVLLVIGFILRKFNFNKTGCLAYPGFYGTHL